MRLQLPAFTLPKFTFYQRLTAREKFLIMIIGVSLLVVINLILLSVLIRSWRDLNLQYSAKSLELDREKVYADQKTALWQPRNDWLKKTQPTIANRNLAGPQLQEAVKATAQANQVIITNTKINPPPPNTADYQPVSVGLSTQSDWSNAVKFMAALQRPEAFLVFNTANLHAEQSDPKQIRGEFTISKLYAPAGK